MVEIRGTAVALRDVDPPVKGMSREIIRITPQWIKSFGLEAGDWQLTRSRLAGSFQKTAEHGASDLPNAEFDAR